MSGFDALFDATRCSIPSNQTDTSVRFSLAIHKMKGAVLIGKLRDHKDRGGLETGNLRKQFKNYEKFAVIFQIRKQQETRKTRKQVSKFLQLLIFSKIKKNHFFLKLKKKLKNLKKIVFFLNKMF